jgi:hypothetical protein
LAVLQEYFRSEAEDWETEESVEFGDTKLDEEEKRTAGFSEEGKYISTDPRCIANLCYHQFPRNSEKFGDIVRMYTGKRVAEMIALLGLENVPWATQLQIFLTRYLESTSTNGSNAITQFTISNQEIEVYGPSIYGTFALLNHSCIGNVIYNFYGKLLVARASRNIKKGEQLFQYSGKSFLKYPLRHRQEIHKEIALFTCKCQACLEDWPMFHFMPISPDLCNTKKHSRKVLRSLYVAGHALTHNCELENGRYTVTAENLQVFQNYIAALEKAGETMNQQYYLILEHIRYFYCQQGNRTPDPNPRAHGKPRPFA